MKCLAQIALDSISGHRIADFFPHGKSDSKMTLHRFSLVVYDKLPISERFPFSKYFLKFFIIFYAKSFFHHNHLYKLIYEYAIYIKKQDITSSNLSVM